MVVDIPVSVLNEELKVAVIEIEQCDLLLFGKGKIPSAFFYRHKQHKPQNHGPQGTFSFFDMVITPLDHAPMKNSISPSCLHTTSVFSSRGTRAMLR